MARRPRIDRELAKYLVDGENVIVAVRRHWFSLVREILLVVGATALAMWADVGTTLGAGGQLLRNGALLLFWGSVLWLVWTVLNWRHEWFVATDKRLLLFYGFIRRRVAMMPLLKVTDMTFDRSPLGRVVGYGNFVLESAGQEQALSEVKYVPDADAHYRAICGQLFGPNSQVRFHPGLAGGWGGWGGPGPGDGPGGGPVPGGGPGPGPGGGPASGGPGTSSASPVTPDRQRGADAGTHDHTVDGEESGPAVVVGPRHSGVSLHPRARRPKPGPQPESWYRSSNLHRPATADDTGEIPVVHPNRRDDADYTPLYPPRDWLQ